MNRGARGDAPNHRALIEDVRRTVLRARELWPGRPVHLLGISWGGKLAVAVGLRYRDRLSSLLLVAPGLYPRVGLSPAEKLAVLFWRFWDPGRLFPIPLVDPHLFTSNPERLAYIEADPLALHFGSARLLMASRSLDLALRGKAQALHLPVLLLLAGRDRIVDTVRVGRFFDALPDAPKRSVAYPEAHHTLEFEADPQPFFAELRRWILEMSEAEAVTAPVQKVR